MDDQVTLEAYSDENRALIHNGRNDEAIAICKHILHYYPKHIDSYRQLGEAYLEKGELDNAKDMFRRVLGADPENVIACVGLATIFEQQHLIDEAVWHLERAYEIAPGNLEIHKELLRLYSEAGKPRQRLKLSPAGLARLYVQEGLYSQATQELRAIAAESPSQFDARVALAEVLWRAGRLREAADAAQALLTPLPYCLKANLILGTAWKESSLAEADVYLSRAQELDPTNKTAQRLLGTRSPLPLAQISVPRYVEGVPPPPAIPPTPAPSVQPTVEPGESITEQPSVERTDFFAETPTIESQPPIATTAPSVSVEAGGESTPKPDLPVANLPPWLLSEFPEPAESKPPTTMPEAKPPAQAESPQTTIEGLPTWLTESQSTTPSAETMPAPEIAKPPSWIEGLGEASASVPAEEKTETAAAPTPEGVPDWLRELQAQSAPAQEPAPTPKAETAQSDEYVVPAFLAPEPKEAQPAAEQPAPAITESGPPIAVELPTTPTTAERAAQTVAATPESTKPAEPTPKRKRQPKGYSHLVLARDHRDANRIDDALVEYDYLVQHAPRLVKEVIDDLEVMTAREDAPLKAHRILGDAYTHADRLAEALERYQFVLERTSAS